MNKVQKLEASGYRKTRNFKTETQAKHYAAQIGVNGRTAKVVPNGTNFLVMVGTEATKSPSVAIAIKDLPKDLKWNDFVSKNLSAYKETLDHKSAMQLLSQEWKAYKAL